MIELLVLSVVCLMVLALVVLLPLMLIGAVLKVVFVVVTLPFRILGALFGAVAAVLGALAKGVVGIVSLVVGAGLIVCCLLFIPLLPILIVGGMIWLLAKLFSPGALSVAG